METEHEEDSRDFALAVAAPCGERAHSSALTTSSDIPSRAPARGPRVLLAASSILRLAERPSSARPPAPQRTPRPRESCPLGQVLDEILSREPAAEPNRDRTRRHRQDHERTFRRSPRGDQQPSRSGQDCPALDDRREYGLPPSPSGRHLIARSKSARRGEPHRRRRGSRTVAPARIRPLAFRTRWPGLQRPACDSGGHLSSSGACCRLTCKL